MQARHPRIKRLIGRNMQDAPGASGAGVCVGVPYETVDTAPATVTDPSTRQQAPNDAGHCLPTRYVFQQLLAEGGMGNVLGVHDTALNRDIVVKAVRSAVGSHPVWESALIEEAQLTAQLDHPNIVPIHDIDFDTQGRVYYSMKRVHGLTLHELLCRSANELGSSSRIVELLEIFLKVCDAVAFAHSRGVVHRDIKPANIMVGEYGEVYLMDWGLALITDSTAVNVTRHPESPLSSPCRPGLGTLSYMAPEQAEGAGDTDMRSDVFALGAVLYHIVTGRAPYTAGTLPQLEALVRSGQYVPVPEATDVFVPQVLCRIIDRALAREPSKRYQSAGELQDHVQRFLHGGLHLPRQTFAPGTEIVREGEPGEHAYLITRGQCDVFKQVGNIRRHVRYLTKGTVFGEMAVLMQSTRTATVVAVDEVEVLVLSQAVVAEGLGANTWESRLVQALVERFREVDERLTSVERQRLLELGIPH